MNRNSWEKGGVMLAGAALVVTGCSSEQASSQGPNTVTSHAVSPHSSPSRQPSKAQQSGSAETGFDISYPQGEGPYPKGGIFGIVGLNGTLANNFNPAFKTQYHWAEQAPGTNVIPGASVYVHVSNAGAQQATKWPASGKDMYGICHGQTDRACSYEYGVQFARGDLSVARHVGATLRFVWLDVEQGYSWQQNPSLNRAVAEGMTQTFETAGLAVGVYATPADWQLLMGGTTDGSPLDGLPDWLRGAQSETDAKRLCQQSGFSGRVLLAQEAGELTSTGFDTDYSC